MNTSLTALDGNNFAAMARAMGMEADMKQSAKANSLARMRISHSAIMGIGEVKGKKTKVEVVPAGTFRLEIPEVSTYYAESIKIRPYMQRFLYKRWDSNNNKFVQTTMGDNLNGDLKDNIGGFNCGKPAGYIEDFKALPKQTQDLIKTIKRVRAVFGTVELISPMDNNGDTVEVGEVPFIWEIDNKDAYKSMGNTFGDYGKHKRLLPQHIVTASTDERPLPNGSSYYVPEFSLDLMNTLNLGDAEQATFSNFIAWIDNYNNYIVNSWNEKALKSNENDVDADIVSDIVDIEIDEDVA